MPELVREHEEYGLPARLSDDAAEEAVDAVVADLAAGDRQAAASRLRDAFPTVCEGERPRTVAVGAAHRVACHLHDEGVCED